MKKTLILAFVGSLCFSAKAQTQFGVQAGGLLNAVTMKYDGEKAEGMKPAVGFKAGVIAKVPLSEDFSFMPELNVLLKGGKQEATGSIYPATYKSTISPLYLEIPLNLAYTTDLGGGSFFLGVGPVVRVCCILGRCLFSVGFSYLVPSKSARVYGKSSKKPCIQVGLCQPRPVRAGWL